MAFFNNSYDTSWRNAPLPIDDKLITKTYEVDVAIIGLGYAGLTAYRTLAELGKTVVVAEAMSKDEWWTLGHDLGHVNSKFQEEHGIPKVDVLEFVNNWQVQTQNKSNVYFIMQFAKHSGETVDWFLEPVQQYIKDAVRFPHFPLNDYSITQLNNGYRYYVGTAQWWQDNWEGRGMRNNGPGLELKNLSWDNQKYVEENFPNAQVLFGTTASELVKKDGRVIGFNAWNEEGEYVRVIGRKGVILAGGGFGKSQEMLNDLLPEVRRMFTPNEKFFAGMDRDGSAIQMGVWAGGRLESTIGSMNFDSMRIPDDVPGPLWVDNTGRRFQNEGFAGPEINGFFMARTKRGTVTSIYDSTYNTQILRGYPGHQAFDYANEVAVKTLCGKFEAARSAGSKGTRDGFYCADTIEELAAYIFAEEEQRSNFIKNVERYNQLCDDGMDMDFGKDPRFMNPVRKPPFYAHVTKANIGFALVTVGGFITTNDMQVVDEYYNPIPGLYAAGNTCGMRFGTGYITPMAGVSIGMAMTLGRILAKNLAEMPE